MEDMAGDSIIDPIKWPGKSQLTREWVRELMTSLNDVTRTLPANELCHTLPAHVVEEVLAAAAKIMAAEPNLVDIRVREDSQVVLVGDTHGQYHDLLRIIEKAGEPSDDSLIVFNGDYVDRGAWGLETYITLLAWKIFLPNRVFLLRGNHETRFCSTTYGFKREVETKYGAQAKHLFPKFLTTFTTHPLAAVVASSILVCHGGLWREPNPVQRKGGKAGGKRKGGWKQGGVSSAGATGLRVGTLDSLMKVRRTLQDPTGSGLSAVLADVLWSDPSPEPGLQPNEARGIGLLFGPDVTQEFLVKNKLRLIVRSHEGPDARDQRTDMKPMDQGYTIDHTVEAGRLMTLFSAPDYPQFQMMEKRSNNKAAFFVLKGPQYWEPEIHTLDAVLPRPKASAYYDVLSYLDSDEEADTSNKAAREG